MNKPQRWRLGTVSEWADQYRILDQAASSEAGKWRTDRTPYLREIMVSLSANSPDDIIVFQKGAQVGATEAGILSLADSRG